MQHVIAAACKGTWQQKWDCGWHQPTTTAANAGYFAGHNVAPALVGLLLVVLIIALASRGRSGKPVTSK
jgi:hypothetical protein